MPAVIKLLSAVCLLAALQFNGCNCSSYHTQCSKVPEIGVACRCDANCNFFNDCCLRKHWISAANRKTWSQLFTCRKYYQALLRGSLFVRMRVYMINKCPGKSRSSTQKSLKYNCESASVQLTDDLIYELPWYNKRTGRVYRNVFCALCHGESVTPWRTRLVGGARIVANVRCARRYMYRNFVEHLKRRRCDLAFNLPKMARRKCITRVVSRCNRKSRAKSQKKCRDGAQYLHKSRRVFYRNKACCECNSKSKRNNRCRVLKHFPIAAMPLNENNGSNKRVFRKWCSKHTWCKLSKKSSYKFIQYLAEKYDIEIPNFQK